VRAPRWLPGTLVESRLSRDWEGHAGCRSPLWGCQYVQAQTGLNRAGRSILCLRFESDCLYSFVRPTSSPDHAASPRAQAALLLAEALLVLWLRERLREVSRGA
jgi:hypothetical protein